MTVVAMPLATSPALYPPMPSARTTRPLDASEATESSLCERTIPGSVSLTICRACSRFMCATRPSEADVHGGIRSGGVACAAERRAQRRGELLAGLVAVLGLLRHRPFEKSHECRLQIRVDGENVRCSFVRDPEHELRYRIPLEGQLAAREVAQPS